LNNNSKAGEQQLCYCSPALQLFSSFNIVFQLYGCSSTLLLFSSFTVVFYNITFVHQLYSCSSTILNRRTTVKLENSCKPEEQQQSRKRVEML
jgi:hypothetical protein